MKQVILTKRNVQQVAKELENYDIIVSVTEETSNLGPGLFDWGFGESGSTFYPADGSIMFTFDEEGGIVSYERSKKIKLIGKLWMWYLNLKRKFGSSKENNE